MQFPTEDGVPYSDHELRALWDVESGKLTQQRAIRHGQFVKRSRLALGLKRPAFVAEVSKLGQEMTADYLNKIESGVRHLANTPIELRDAIRSVLGVSLDDWVEETGLYAPGAPIYEKWREENWEKALSSGDSSDKILPKELQPKDTIIKRFSIYIPAELTRMIKNNSKKYPQLLDTRIQSVLAAPAVLGSKKLKTEDDWLEYWLITKNWYIS